MSQMQEDGVAQRSEKDEMARLYDELLRQLKSAEEEKEQLQVQQTMHLVERRRDA